MMRQRSALRQGIITFELLVSAGLIVCMIGVLAPLTVRTSRMINDGRQVRMAVSELSNQIDFLTRFERERLLEELETLNPSEEVRQALPNAKLAGEVKSDSDGSRLILTIDWDRPVKGNPLSLVAWIDAAPMENNTAQSTTSAPSSVGSVSDSSRSQGLSL